MVKPQVGEYRGPEKMNGQRNRKKTDKDIFLVFILFTVIHTSPLVKWHNVGLLHRCLSYIIERVAKDLCVLFENDSCLILNKPPGLAVQGGEGVKVSLDSILSEHYSVRPLLVHRLDKDTSGVILVAKTREAAAGFSALFAGGQGKKGRALVKQYLGVCSGIPKPEQGIIRLKLEVRGSGRQKSEKESETRYQLLSTRTVTGADGEFPCSLLELELGTGRMHQIRRHLARIAHPLLGDDKYGDFSLNKNLRKACALKHLLLHASRLVIPPVTPLLPGGLDISAPLPEYFSPFNPLKPYQE